MKVIVKLDLILKEIVGNEVVELYFPGTIRVDEILEHLGLNHGEVGLIIAENNQQLTLEDEITADVKLSLFPIIGGG